MANHPQAKKRNLQRIKLQAHHRHYRSTMRSHIKRVRMAVEAKDLKDAKQALDQAIPLIDRCASRGIIPKKRASRLVSRLSSAVNTVAAT